MIAHLLKLIWNKRKSNGMMIAEIFLSFIVLFGVLTFGVDNYKQFSSPNGFSVENLLEVALEWETTVDSATLHQQKSTLRQEILGMSNVGHVAYSLHNTPYSHSQWINGNDDDDGLKFETHYFNVDENFDEALDIKISEGRWFTDDDNTSKVLPVVINQKLKDELFPNESVIGKQIKISNEYKIIGIIENFKYEGIFAQEPNCSFINFPSITHATGNFMTHDCKLMVKLKEPISQKNEFAIYQKINSTVNNCVFTINSMENKKQETGKSTYMTLVVISTVSFFLIFNVALGIFGVLWSNINKRRPEIGLRRAMGATPIQIIGQILGETVFITTLGIIIGLFFAVQFPLLKVFDLPNNVYFTAIGLTMLIIYGIVVFCSLYPSWMASRIHPANVLHEN